MPFDFTMKNRENADMIKEVFKTIDTLSKIQGGTLVFFPSYSIMTKYKEFWES